MGQLMNNSKCTVIHKIEKYVFFVLILSIPFTDFSINIPLVGYYLPHLFILLGVCLIIFEKIKYNFQYSCLEKYFCIFWGITFIWYTISNLHGFFTYSFFDPSHWSDLKEMLFLEKYFSDFFYRNNNIAISMAASLYFIRMSFMECLYFCGGTFLAIHIYQNYSKKGFNDFEKSVTVLVIAIIFYSVIEIPALMGNELCKSFLSTINHCIMSVNHIDGTWPPEFWPLQVRSIFTEPSFFGLGAAALFPFLLHWSIFYDQRAKLVNFREIIIFAYILLAFATRSRTTTVMVLTEAALFVFLSLGIRALDKKKLLKVILSIIIAFFISLPMMSMFSGTWYDRNDNKNSITSMVDNYVEDNITSVVDGSKGGQKRSNSIRTTLNKAYTYVGIAHPILGVGFGMTAYYVDKNISDTDAKNNELEIDSKNLHEKGERKAGFPILNYFAYQFATYGFIGLLLYLLPICYVLFYVLRNIKKLCMEEITLLTALLGSVASCFSNAPLVSIYIITGLLSCFIYNNCIKIGTKV